jgi:predicted short-subunit dehydrogenase-like oxidoreductase (DUF2520 family)
MTPNPIVFCPACESGELRPGPLVVRCSGCDYALSRDLFLALRRIRALPEAEHPACRCGHPETRRLPGGVLGCPVCGEEEGAQREAPRKA